MFCQYLLHVMRAKLAIWIVFVLLLQINESFSADKLCKNPVPGLHRLRSGVDISALDLMPLEGTTPHAGFRQPVFDFSCNEGKTWRHGKTVYDVPDQVWNIARIPTSWLSNRVEVFEDIDEVKKAMSVNVHVSSSFLSFGGFSMATSYRAMKETLRKRSNKIAQVSASVSTWRVDLLPYWGVNFTKHVASYVENRLPSQIANDNDAQRYVEFIEYFGTHFFKSGKYGGVITMEFKTSSEYFKHRSKSSFALDAQAWFNFVLKFEGGVQIRKASQENFANFTRLTTTSTRFYGGDTSLFAKQKDIKNWQKTVPVHPWLFSGSLAPIYSVVKDSKKKENMKRAVKVYLGKMYMKELLTDTQWFVDEGLNTAKSFHKKMTTFMEQKRPPYDRLKALIKDIRYSLRPPLWFTKKTQFCEKWEYPWYRPNKERYNDCNTNEFRKRCAKPNTMTGKIYHKNNQRFGCERAWTISSWGYDDWFGRVKVCFRSINRFLQKCGPWKQDEDCKPVNKYSPPFVTNNAYSCMLQWKLDIPDDSALWATKLQICIQRSKVDDRKYCGGENIPDRICARAGTWTNYFTARTYSTGGCYLQWGLYYEE